MDNLWIEEKIQMKKKETADYIVLRNDNEIIFGGRRGLIYVAKYKDNTWNFDKFGETNSLISLIIGKNELVSVDFEKITIWIEERHKWKKY